MIKLLVILFIIKLNARNIFICSNIIREALSKVHYFSDECAGQYKNCKIFLNLCLHNGDFRVKSKYNFFFLHKSGNHS